MAVIPIERTVSLDEPIKVEKLTGTLFTAESNAHKFIITCTRGGDPEAVTGTVTARFKRQNGSAVFITGGVEGDAACVVLTADCYNQPGGFQLTVFTTEGGSTLAIYSAVGVVTSTVDGELIDGGNTIPRSVDEVAAYLEQYAPRVMTGATPTTDGVAGLVPAPNSLASTYYLRGDGTWNNLETIIYSLYPYDIASGDSLEGVHTPGAIMANSVPYKEITVTLESGEGISYDDFSLQFKRRSGTGNHFYYSTYRTITLNFLEILGEPYDGTGWISFNMLNGSVTIVGKNKTIAIEPQVQFRDSYIFGDKAGTIRVYYLRDLQNIVTDYGTRITALENAST